MEWRSALSHLRLPGDRGMAGHVAWMARDFGRRDRAPLSAEDVEALARFLEPVEARAGQRILSPGEPAEAAYVVERGEVELLVRKGRRRALVAIQRTGGVFGDVPLLCDIPFPFVAVARTEATLLRLDRDQLVDLLSTHPAIALRWLTNVVKRLERANRRVVELTVGDLRARTLALLADEVIGHDGHRAQVRLTQSEIAALLGATRQSVNRVLRRLAGEGLVEQRYGEIEVTDPERIIQLAGGGPLARVC